MLIIHILIYEARHWPVATGKNVLRSFDSCMLYVDDVLKDFNKHFNSSLVFSENLHCRSSKQVFSNRLIKQ